jgi:sensor histidine kinase YesM
MESPEKVEIGSQTDSAGGAQRPWKRRVLLINPKFQLTFLFYMLVIAATIIVVLYVANVFFFRRSYEAGQTLGLPPDHIYFTFIDNQRSTMKWIFLLASGVTMVNLTFWGLYLSHRVAGPIYRLRKHMVELAEGKTNRDVNFRTNDFFPELAEAFNQFVKTLKRK